MKNKKELTVIIVNDFDYIQGGASKVALDTAKLLHDNGINVIFFSATHKENSYSFKQVCTNQKECISDGPKGLFRNIINLKVKKEFSKLLSSLDNKKTIIHVHGWTKSLSSVIFKVAQKKQFKVVQTLHDYFTVCPNGGFYNYNKCEICRKKALSLNCITTNCDSRNYIFKIYRCIRQMVQNINTRQLKNINYFISISDFSVDKLKKYIPATSVIKKIYNPISVQKTKRVQIEKNKYYIYVGRITKEKGVDLFCKAISELRLEAVIVGDGNQKTYLEEKYKNTKIKFVGWQDTQSVNKYLEKSKGLVFPSKWYEGAPLTILESLSKGVPCIVSDQCAGIEFINSKNGMIYDGTSVEDLKEKILKYEKIDKKVLSQSTYDNYWENPYTEQKYIDNLLRFYYDCVTNRC